MSTCGMNRSSASPANLTVVLSPLSLEEYDQFRVFLGRVEPEVPQRFEIISALMSTNHAVAQDAATYRAVYMKLRLHLGGRAAEKLDVQHRDVRDTNDYGKYVVIALPKVTTCVLCGGGLTVNRNCHPAFFYRQSGECLQGSVFHKECKRKECTASSFSYGFWKGGKSVRKLYPPSRTDFNPLAQEFFQSTNVTFHETKLLHETELSLYHGHMGFLTKARVFNGTHFRTRKLAPPAGAANDADAQLGDGRGAPPPAGTSTPQERASEKATMRFAIDRRRLSGALYTRRIEMVAREVAPHLINEITDDIPTNLSLAMVQVSNCGDVRRM